MSELIKFILSKCKSDLELEDCIKGLENAVTLDWQPIEEAPLGVSIVVRDENRQVTTMTFSIGSTRQESGYAEYLFLG